MSCVQFIERISCKFMKMKNPNKNTEVQQLNVKHKPPPTLESASAAERNIDSDGESGSQEAKKDLGLVPFIGLNDWFDPVFIHKKIDSLKKHNKIESLDGSHLNDNSEISFTSRMIRE